MARSNTGSTSNYMRVTSTPVTTTPYTVSIWAKVVDATNSYNLFALNDGSGSASSDYATLVVSNGINSNHGSATPGFVSATTAAGGIEDSAVCTIPFAANTWNHYCGVWTSSSSRTVYMNGSGKLTDVNSLSPAPMAEMNIGVIKTNALFSPINGSVADAAIWNVALTDSEVMSLALGVHPFRIRPQSLVGFWELNGLLSPEPDTHPGGTLSTRYNMTITGSMPQTNNPPNNSSLRKVFYVPPTDVVVPSLPILGFH